MTAARGEATGHRARRRGLDGPPSRSHLPSGSFAAPGGAGLGSGGAQRRRQASPAPVLAAATDATANGTAAVAVVRAGTPG